MKIIHIAGFELRRLLLSPLAWIVWALVQFILALLFYMLLSQYLQQPDLYAGRGLTEVVVAGFFQSAGLILLLITPFLTMRLVSEELRSGTIRLLLSSPVSISAMVLGKYLGVIVYMLCLVLIVSLMPASLMLGTRLDTSQFISGILGLVLLMCASAAIGLFVSSMFRHPVAAAATTFAVIFLFWTIHVAGTAGNATGNSIFIYLSIPHHFNPFTAGIINTDDLVFFLLLTLTGIFLSVWRLDGLRSYHW